MEKKSSWREEALSLYFHEKKSISEVSEITGVSRQSISALLNSLPELAGEKEARKAENRKRRREYKRDKNREYRENYRMAVTPETMKREHELAVMELSHER